MHALFQTCQTMVSVGDLSKWVTSNVTDMRCMFNHCVSLTSVGDLSNWDTSKVTDMSLMFQDCILTNIGTLENWDVSNVKTMNKMFLGTAIEKLDLHKWNPEKCTDMIMFANITDGARCRIKKTRSPISPKWY